MPTPSTQILLIRHGETAWNAERRLQGHIDIPLNQAGEQQAQLLGQALQHEKIDAIIASDLLRARQTAQALLQSRSDAGQLSLRIDPDLRERCFGGFEGLSHQQLAQLYPREFAAYKARDPAVPLPDGVRPAEAFADFYQRVLQALSRWAMRFTGQKIAVVAHGGVLECAYRAAHGMPLNTPRDFDIFNASVNRFRWQDGGLSVLQWGDCAHLECTLDEIKETEHLAAA
ncbi:histidine phosphatase family protein [Massilia sp. W12]|uniref:histidine phosphatase family protein n=1 Tax=Massilia sp. W12 TaxID=3126507 RepID=UPI0030CA5C35